MATNYYNLPTLASVQGDIGDCLEDLLVEDSGNSGMETIDTTLHNHEQNINKLSGVVETFAVSSWTADATIAPFTYKATVTLQTTLTNETIVELLNDDAVLFATYGFSIGGVASQVVTIYSIGEPESAVSISIRIGGVLSNSGGGSSTSLYQHFIRFGNSTFNINVAFVDTDSISHDTSNTLDYIKTYCAKTSAYSSAGVLVIPCSGFYNGSTHNQIVFYLMYNVSSGSLTAVQAVGGTAYDIGSETLTYALDSVIPLQ